MAIGLHPVSYLLSGRSKVGIIGERQEADCGTRSAWTSKPIKQDVVYEDKQGFEASLQKLRRLPPLVTPREVRFTRALLDCIIRANSAACLDR
jgi:3-deoxy-D-arabino-heptulosonate 7-phosphate (DAHP) synthase class II